MRTFTLILTLLFCIGLQVVNAQKTITGTVASSEDGMVLSGVSVVVKGTTTGTISDLNGKYSIDVPENAITLVFAYVGMVTKEVEIGAGSVIDVNMVPDIMSLDEVVVTALGISREKKSLGYAVQEIDGEDVAKTQNVNLINSISGKVSGVQVKNNTNIGGSSNIIIRGSSSLTGNNQALFVVDGVPINNLNSNKEHQMEGYGGYDYGNPVSDIDPNNIESMSVLKGAAATALYGSRAANGVILITTKKGKKTLHGQKKLVVSIKQSTMFHEMDKSTFPEYQQEYGQGYGPYYSGPLADNEPTDYPGLYMYDFDGDGILDYVEPTTEDASVGSKFDPDLMIYNWASFYPQSPTYMQKVPYVAGANGPDYFIRTGKTFINSFNITGSTPVSTYRLAYTNQNQTGIFPNSEIKKNSISFNGSFDLRDNLTVSSSANYINTNTLGRNKSGYSDDAMAMFRQWYNVGVDVKLQEDYYHLTKTNITWNTNSKNDLSALYYNNPYWTRYENYQSDKRDRLIGYTQIDWKLNDAFDFMTRASLDYYTFIQEERKAVGSTTTAFGVTRPRISSGYARNTYTFSETNYDAILRFNTDLTEGFNIYGLVGTNYRKSILDNVFESTNGGLAVPGTYALSNSASPMLPPEESLETIGVFGVFANVSIGLMNTYFLDLTARNDVSSTLPDGNNSYFYPGISFSFLFSELLNQSFLNLGKVRLNYAKVGNDAPWGRVNDSYRIVSPLDGSNMARLTEFKNNSDLKPEISSSQEAGLELAMIDNRIGLDFAMYKTNSVNQVLPLAVSYATGYEEKYVNIGEIENRGVEILLKGTPVKTTDLSWDIIVNWSTYTNEVISLGDEIYNLQLANLQKGVSINAREGEPYGTIQSFDYLYSPDGQKLINQNGYYHETSTSDNVLGNVQADWNGGISNTIRYKSVSLSFLIDMQKGGDIYSLDMRYGMFSGLYPETIGDNDLGNPMRDPIYDANGNELLSYIDLPDYDPALGYGANSGGHLLEGVVWTDVNGDGIPDQGDTYEKNIRRVAGNDSRVYGLLGNTNKEFIYDASYVKLRELSLTFQLPKSLLEKAFISDATISIIGTNLWIIHKNLPYADPEASQGAGNIQGWQSGVLPATKNFGFSLNLQF